MESALGVAVDGAGARDGHVFHIPGVDERRVAQHPGALPAGLDHRQVVLRVGRKQQVRSALEVELDAALQVDRAVAAPDARGQHHPPATFSRRLGDGRQDGGARIRRAVTNGPEVGHAVDPRGDLWGFDAGDDGLDQTPVHPAGRGILGSGGPGAEQQQQQGHAGTSPAVDAAIVRSCRHCSDVSREWPPVAKFPFKGREVDRPGQSVEFRT